MTNVRAAPGDLKPCPFCGSTDIANVSAGYAGPTDRWHAGDGIFAVNCRVCGASVPQRHSNAWVVAAWNKRVGEASIGTAEVWSEAKPPKRGAYRVRRVGLASTDYGYSYWDGERWGTMASTRKYAQESQGTGRKTPSKYPMQWLQKAGKSMNWRCSIDG